MNNKDIYFIDLFCGAGGLSIGFERVGFKCVFANDIEEDFINTLKANHPHIGTKLGDIRNLKGSDILESTGLSKGAIKLIVGGPPCQGFSTVGKRWLEDPRNQLFREYYRVVKEISPEVFVFENVTGLMSMDGGAVLEEIIKLFSELGYKVKYQVLNAVEYGVPQHRERIIIVGSKKDKEFNYPRPTHSIQGALFDLKPAITMAEALSDLPLIEAGEESNEYLMSPQNEYQKARRKSCTELSYHNAPSHGESLLNVISRVPEGGSYLDIPEEHWPTSGYPNSYARLWWDRPTTTLTRNFGTPSSARCIHPKCHRGLTAREGARIQSFDDDYIFAGAKTSRNLQIGNAVPPLLAEAIAKEIKLLFT